MKPLPPPGSRVGEYARFSSELQQFSSIEGQVLSMDSYAAKKGWIVVARHHDAARSGTTTMGRSGLLQLMLDAEQGKIDVVLLEDLDRISRDAADMHLIAKELDELGVTLCTVASGVVTDIEMAFKAVQSQQFIQQNIQKSKRGQELAIESGRASGSIAYGYRKTHKVDAKGEPINGLREIWPSRAVIVQRIYMDFAAGKTTFEICRELNAEGIPGPKGGLWRPGGLLGNRNGGLGILRNPIYIGELHFRKTERRRRKGQIKMRFRPVEERKVVQHPELVIIDRELWSIVQAKLGAEVDRPFHAKKKVLYLFSGKVFCGECGCSCLVSDGRFVCTGRRVMGCTNSRRVAREAVETTVLLRIKEHLVVSGLIQPCVDAYREELERVHAEHRGRSEAQQNRLKEIEQRLASLLEQMAVSRDLQFAREYLANEMDRLGAEKKRLEHELLSWSPEIVQVVKVGSTERKDGPDDGQAEAVFG